MTKETKTDNARENTDRELWRTTEGDYYSKHKIYISENGGALTICEDGFCVTRHVAAWFESVRTPSPTSVEHGDVVERPDAAIEALMNYSQADEDGVMVYASRQAIHEVVGYIEALSAIGGNHG